MSWTRREQFWAECEKKWEAAIAEAAGTKPAASMTWRGLATIREALLPFMGSNVNHGHYPTGGGMDFQNVETAAEPGCLAISVSDRQADIVKPKSLTLEYFAEAPRQSFLLLELGELSPSGVHKHNDPYKEDIFECPLGHYGSPEIWERGYLGYDENDREIPLPQDGRPATRWFGGQILIVAKGSLWNGDSATYDGQHNRMTAAQIRKLIERSMTNGRNAS